jgi:hypothetical protein
MSTHWELLINIYSTMQLEITIKQNLYFIMIDRSVSSN